jgi:hypothetical protein
MYEIPQQLEYKEKIVFGLTFEQLMYAMIFLPFAVMFFRMNVAMPVKIFLISIPVSLAAGFMFFDLLSKIKDWYWWYKFREIKEPEKLKKLFGAEIRSNLIGADIRLNLIILK